MLLVKERTTRLRCLSVISNRAQLWRKSALGKYFGAGAVIELMVLHRALQSTEMDHENDYECKRLTMALTEKEIRSTEILGF